MKRLARIALTGAAAIAVTSGLVGTPAHAAPVPAPAASAKMAGPVKPSFTTLKFGMRGSAVTKAQLKLVRIGYLTKADGYFGTATRDAVLKLQTAYGHTTINGEINSATMATINILYDRALRTPAGTLTPGMVGASVKSLQQALTTLGHYSGPISGTYTQATKNSVAQFQRAHGISAVRGYATWPTRVAINDAYKRALAAQRYKLHVNCMTGRAFCVDKTARKVHFVVNGKIQKTLDARFARPGYATPTGNYRVYRKIYKDWSRAYRAWMPFSIYYDGGRAIHYSYGFAAEGFNGGSHGCVNLRDWNGAQWMYNQARIGDKVIIYFS